MAYIWMKDDEHYELVSSVGRFHKEVNLRLERDYDSTHNSDGMWVRVMPSHTDESSDSSDEDSSDESMDESSDESSDEYSDEDSEIPDSDVDSEMESDARS